MKSKSLITSLILLFILFTFTFPAKSEEKNKMRIAILELKAEGVAEKTARAVTNMLRTDMINLGKYTIIERTQMDAILKEQGFQQTGCTDQECAVQLGKILSARKILIGEVSSVENAIIITVRIVDVEKAVSEYASREKAASINTIDSTVTILVNKLSNRIETGYEGAPIGYYYRGLVPGWGQFYSGNTIKGFVYAGAFVLSASYMGYAIFDFRQKRGDYEDSTDPQTASDTWDTAQTALQFAYISIGIVAAVYVVNLVDIFFFSKPGNLQDLSKMHEIHYGDKYFTFNAYNSCGFNKEKFLNVSLGTRF